MLHNPAKALRFNRSLLNYSSLTSCGCRERKIKRWSVSKSDVETYKTEFVQNYRSSNLEEEVAVVFFVTSCYGNLAVDLDYPLWQNILLLCHKQGGS